MDSGIDAALEKAVRPDMMKHILKTRTQMVEIIYKYFDSDLSESHVLKKSTMDKTLERH
jgi:hypothetical protein